MRSRRSRMVEDLAELVAVESPSTDRDRHGGQRRRRGRARRRAARLGAGAAPARTCSGATAPTRVLLLGHHDTVWPMGTLARWPFAGRRATAPPAPAAST